MVDYQYGDTALQDQLTGALIGLARVTDGNEHLITPASTAVIPESLSVLSNPNHNPAELLRLLTHVVEQKRSMVPDCFSCASPCGKNSDYDMRLLHTAQKDIRSLKYSILHVIQEIAACVHPYCNNTLEHFIYKALIVIGMDDYELEDLQPILQEAEELKPACMDLAEKAGSVSS